MCHHYRDGRTFTRTQKLMAPRLPRIVSPIAQREWLRAAGHCSEMVLFHTPESRSSVNEVPSAAATVETIVLCDGGGGGTGAGDDCE